MLGEKIEKYNAKVFLVNTGWTGGEYGVGQRMNLSYTRAMVKAALNGELDNMETGKDDVFGLEIPLHVPGVPDGVLMPEQTWTDKEAYRAKALDLASKFKENFKKFTSVSEEIVELGGPLV
jgi:phosphoenolpyruvate carboxykinase (ATP)